MGDPALSPVWQRRLTVCTAALGVGWVPLPLPLWTEALALSISIHQQDLKPW